MLRQRIACFTAEAAEVAEVAESAKEKYCLRVLCALRGEAAGALRTRYNVPLWMFHQRQPSSLLTKHRSGAWMGPLDA